MLGIIMNFDISVILTPKNPSPLIVTWKFIRKKK